MVQWWDSLGQVDVWSWGSWRSFPRVMILWILWSYSLLLLVYRGNRINPNHNPRIFILTVLPNFSSWWMYDNLWRWSVLKILNKVLWKRLEFRLQLWTEQLILELGSCKNWAREATSKTLHPLFCHHVARSSCQGKDLYFQETHSCVSTNVTVKSVKLVLKPGVGMLP